MVKTTGFWRILFALCVPSTLTLGAQSSQRNSASSAQRVRFDTSVHVGTFPNGLRYYIQHNATPEKRAELRLVVNAGSVLEDDDQRGLAHLIEHMAFNGTRRFPGLGIIRYLESIGLIFGDDVNAGTSFEETTYMLTVPTEPAVLDTATMILEDWAHGVTFDSVQVEQERGVVMEERRLGLGPGTRMFELHMPTLYRGTKYAQRSPIGIPQVLLHAPRSALTRFYHDWYRPDLMTVVAVGDFDPEQLRKKFAATLGRIPMPKSPRPRPPIHVTPPDSAIVSVASDAQFNDWEAMLVFPRSQNDTVVTSASIRRDLVYSMIYQVLNNRFKVLARSPDSSITGARMEREQLGRYLDADQITLASSPSSLERGVAAVRAELARLARDGVTPTEFARARAMMQERVTEGLLTVQRRPSGVLASRYVSSALLHRPVVDPAAQLTLERQFLSESTSNDVRAAAAAINEARAPLVLVNVPKSSFIAPPDPEVILEAMRFGAREKLGPYLDTASVNTPLVTAVKSGTIAHEQTYPAAGITEWRLTNGARVVIKQTPFAPDQLTIQAVAPGGTSLASDRVYASAAAASSFIQLGQYDKIALQLRLGNTVKQADIKLTPVSEMITTAGAPRYAPTLFQILNLAFTDPRIDTAAFRKWKEHTRRDTGDPFELATERTISQRNPQARPIIGTMVDSVNADSALAFYKARVADAGRFTFVIVGDVSLDSLRPLVERYLGGLPGHPDATPELPRDLGMRFPPQPVDRTIVGDDSASKTRVLIDLPLPYTATTPVTVEAATNIMNIRLRNRLREDMSGTYGVVTKGIATSVPYPHVRLQITFTSEPERARELQHALFAVLDTLAKTGVTDLEMQEVRQMLRRRHEVNAQSEEYWVTLLQHAAQEGEPVDAVVNRVQDVSTVTTDDVNAILKALVASKHQVVVTSLPVRLAPVEKDELLQGEW
jgi:zinc protease